MLKLGNEVEDIATAIKLW